MTHRIQLCLLKPLPLLAGSKRKPLGTPCYQISLLEPGRFARYFQKFSFKNPPKFFKIPLYFKNFMLIEVAILKLPWETHIKSPFPSDCLRHHLREGRQKWINRRMIWQILKTTAVVGFMLRINLEIFSMFSFCKECVILARALQMLELSSAQKGQ